MWAFYTQTDGDNWIENYGWGVVNEDLSPCHWYGVICDPIDGKTVVTQLRLSANRLRGPIPKELGQLKHLTALQVYSNYLSGAIPETIMGLEQLSGLYLMCNDGLTALDEVAEFVGKIDLDWTIPCTMSAPPEPLTSTQLSLSQFSLPQSAPPLGKRWATPPRNRCLEIKPFPRILTGAPRAPQEICGKPGEGFPTISWRNDRRADWYRVVIWHPAAKLIFLDQWYAKSTDDLPAGGRVPGSDGWRHEVECNDLKCEIYVTHVNFLTGSYLIYMQSWGTPTKNLKDGQFGNYGSVEGHPTWSGAVGRANFEIPNIMPPAVSSLSLSYPLKTKWQAVRYATHYDIWVGTAPPDLKKVSTLGSQ